jgi:cytoplasmic iron level regulating protein YaaA (DUF328/UPF0246 family)
MQPCAARRNAPAYAVRVLILLPPSEGKSAPARGKPVDLGALDIQPLTTARAAVVTALVDLCSEGSAAGVERASTILGVGPTQADLVRRNAGLLTAPAARADRIYTGVLYDALDLGSLEGMARRRASRWLVVMSSLLGAVRPHDRIPAYRLSGDTRLPGIGTVSAYWRGHLDAPLTEAAGRGLVVDLRSSTYAAFWRPAPGPRLATVRVLQEVDGHRKVVSHFNKATKGRIVRDLLLDGGAPATPGELADQLAALGWKVETQPADRSGTRLDVVVAEL